MTDKKKSQLILCTCGKQLNLDFDSLSADLGKISMTETVTIHDTCCQEDGLEKIAEIMKKKDTPLVIGACTNQKLQPRIDQFLKQKGIDP